MCVRSGNTGIGVWAKQESKNEKKKKTLRSLTDSSGGTGRWKELLSLGET